MADKVHPATSRKLARARENGQVWRAPLLVQGIGIIAFIVICVNFKTMVLEALHNLLELIGQGAGDCESATLLAAIAGIGWVFLTLLGTAVISTLSACLFGGFVLSSRPMCIDFERINPATGCVRVAQQLRDGWQLVARLVVSISVLAITMMSWRTLQSFSVQSFSVQSFSAQSFSAQSCSLLWIAAALLVLTGAFDAFMRRRKFSADQRMTEVELRREFKDNDGDPHLRAMQRSLRESLSRGEMINRLKRAKVLVVRRAKGPA